MTIASTVQDLGQDLGNQSLTISRRTGVDSIQPNSDNGELLDPAAVGLNTAKAIASAPTINTRAPTIQKTPPPPQHVQTVTNRTTPACPAGFVVSESSTNVTAVGAVQLSHTHTMCKCARAPCSLGTDKDVKMTANFQSNVQQGKVTAANYAQVLQATESAYAGYLKVRNANVKLLARRQRSSRLRRNQLQMKGRRLMGGEPPPPAPPLGDTKRKLWTTPANHTDALGTFAELEVFTELLLSQLRVFKPVLEKTRIVTDWGNAAIPPEHNSFVFDLSRDPKFMLASGYNKPPPVVKCPKSAVSETGITC